MTKVNQKTQIEWVFDSSKKFSEIKNKLKMRNIYLRESSKSRQLGHSELSSTGTKISLGIEKDFLGSSVYKSSIGYMTQRSKGN